MSTLIYSIFIFRNESTQSVTKGAEIFYEPDDYDDWDEEDPDNDLEFS